MNQKSAVIGVMPLWDAQRESYWMVPGYLQGLEQQGAVPLMLPLTDAPRELDYFLESCDGFLLTGGQDLDPAQYDRQDTGLCGETCPLRDRMDRYILTQAVERGKAVLGICRGLQLMNAAYGGTLYQDLPTQHPSPVSHQMKPPYDRAAHQVALVEGTPLQQLLGVSSCGVNSYHHQGIDRLAAAFRPMAQAPDGLVEGIYMPHKPFVWAVQWHPEFSYRTDGNSQKLFQAFVQAARRERL